MRSPPPADVPEQEGESAQPSPVEEAIGGALLARYDEALERLRESDRELVIAHVEFDFSHPELATESGSDWLLAACASTRGAGFSRVGTSSTSVCGWFKN